MVTPIKLILTITLSIYLSSCGYLLRTPDERTYSALSLGDSSGSLIQEFKQPVVCDKNYLLNYWGMPDKKESINSETEIWKYKDGLRWVGFSPWLILPAPLFVPIGNRYFEFKIVNDKVINMKHLTIRSRTRVLPIENESLIDSWPKYQTVKPDVICTFNEN